jgi:hypothetical protein
MSLQGLIEDRNGDRITKTDPSYYYIVFLFYYSVLYDEAKLRYLLKVENGILVKFHGRVVLNILSAMLPSHFYEELIFNDLEQLLHLD